MGGLGRKPASACSPLRSIFRPAPCILVTGSITGIRLPANRTWNTNAKWASACASRATSTWRRWRIPPCPLTATRRRAFGGHRARWSAAALTTSTFACKPAAVVSFRRMAATPSCTLATSVSPIPRSPYAFLYPAHSSQLVLKIERAQLKARLPHFRSLMALAVSGKEATAALAAGFIGMLPRYRNSISGVAELRIADQALDLAALALSRAAGNWASTFRRPRLRRSCGCGKRSKSNLCQRGLRCADVAAVAGMSLRYANHLLMQEGTSLERFIQRRRLEKCRDALRDPAQSHRSVSEIAFSWGFSDASHFARSFKTAYGTTPRDYRREGR